MRLAPYNILFSQQHFTEDGDPSDDEDELEVGGVTQDFKCPITLVVLEDPMTSYVIYILRCEYILAPCYTQKTLRTLVFPCSYRGVPKEVGRRWEALSRVWL